MLNLLKIEFLASIFLDKLQFVDGPKAKVRKALLDSIIFRINTDPKEKTKYLLLLVAIGAELERSLDILNRRNLLFLGSLPAKIAFKNHPVARATNFTVNLNKNSKTKMSQKEVVTWHNIFTNILYELQLEVKRILFEKNQTEEMIKKVTL